METHARTTRAMRQCRSPERGTRTCTWGTKRCVFMYDRVREGGKLSLFVDRTSRAAPARRTASPAAAARLHRYISKGFEVSSVEAARLRAANLRRVLSARKLLLVLDLDHTLLNSCRCAAGAWLRLSVFRPAFASALPGNREQRSVACRMCHGTHCSSLTL